MLKTYRNKKNTDRKLRVISCTTVITVKTQIADTYAQLSGCCSSSVDVNKTLTHFFIKVLKLGKPRLNRILCYFGAFFTRIVFYSPLFYHVHQVVTRFRFVNHY